MKTARFIPPVVVASVCEADEAAAAAGLAAAHAGAGLVELRADDLEAATVARLVRGSARPTIVTVRRPGDGGTYRGDENGRIGRLEAALTAGAAFVDVELGSGAERLVGDAAGRVILSHHGAPCEPDALEELRAALAASPAARLKLVPLAETPGQVGAVRDALGRDGSQGRLACFAMGRAGAVSRILAPAWGSWATYGAARRERPTAPGQFTAADLLDVYDVLGIGATTRLALLIGERVFSSPSPAMHNAGYRAAGLERRYLPVELDAFDAVRPLLDPAGAVAAEALAVTMPHKQAAAAWSRPADAVARASGAVNTVTREAGEWCGANTDGPAALRLIAAHVAPSGARVAIAGAGGTARAIAAALREAGAEVMLFNRSPDRGREAARAVGVASGEWSDLARCSWDVLVQATPLGGAGERVLAPAALTGSVVLDAVYGPRPTPLVEDARRRGLVAIDGFQLLVEQALLQFDRIAGRPSEREILASAGRAWLAGGIDPAGRGASHADR